MQARGDTLRLLRDEFGEEVFTTAMAEAAGVSGPRLQRALARGDLQRVGRGRFCTARPEPGSRADYLARLDALMLERPTAAAAGIAAAACWDLPCPDPWGDWGRLPIVLASPRPLSRAAGLVNWAMGARATMRLDRRNVTDLPTTAVDVARQLPIPEALIVVDAAARRLAGTTDRARLHSSKLRERVRAAFAPALAATPRPSGIRARTCLAWADPAADSPPESYIRGHLRQSGLPTPTVNPPVMGASGKRYYVDLLWPEALRGLEIDGRMKYTDPKVLHWEKRRQEDIEATGIRISRRLAADVFGRPAVVVAGLRAVL
jgi:hypothetical protein